MSLVTGLSLQLEKGDFSGSLINAAQEQTSNGSAIRVLADGAVNFGNVLNDLFTSTSAKFSIGFFVKGSNINALLSKLGDTLHGEDNRQFMIRATNGYVGMVYFRSNGIARGVIANQYPINDNELHHVGISYDNTLNTNNGLDRVNIYIDAAIAGKELNVNVGSLPDRIDTKSARLSLGAAIGAAGPVRYGSEALFDELRIYNKILSSSEWAELAAGQQAYQISGVVEVDFVPGPAELRLYDAQSGLFIKSHTVGTTGEYELPLPTSDPVYVMCIPSDDGYQAIVHGPVVPKEAS